MPLDSGFLPEDSLELGKKKLCIVDTRNLHNFFFVLESVKPNLTRKAKQRNNFAWHKFKVKGRGHGQRSGSRSNFWRTILGARLCRVQQKSKEESLSVQGVCLCVE